MNWHCISSIHDLQLLLGIGSEVGDVFAWIRVESHRFKFDTSSINVMGNRGIASFKSHHKQARAWEVVEVLAMTVANSKFLKKRVSDCRFENHTCHLVFITFNSIIGLVLV